MMIGLKVLLFFIMLCASAVVYLYFNPNVNLCDIRAMYTKIDCDCMGVKRDATPKNIMKLTDTGSYTQCLGIILEKREL